jgi:hypothetical protein
VATYADVCRAWGRRHYTATDGIDRLAELLTRVVDAADPLGWPLYAGWRIVEVAADPPARLAQLLHVLREHRGGAFLSALRVAGLSPLEAILTDAGGPAMATFFGWPEPFPTIDVGVRARRPHAEELTDEMVGPAYAALSAGESQELLELLAMLSKSAK